MLDACLKKQGGNGCALLSSIEYYDGKTREASTLTTPESLELCRHMRNAVDAGLSHMVMEVSSRRSNTRESETRILIPPFS